MFHTGFTVHELLSMFHTVQVIVAWRCFTSFKLLTMFYIVQVILDGYWPFIKLPSMFTALTSYCRCFTPLINWVTVDILHYSLRYCRYFTPLVNLLATFRTANADIPAIDFLARPLSDVVFLPLICYYSFLPPLIRLYWHCCSHTAHQLTSQIANARIAVVLSRNAAYIDALQPLLHACSYCCERILLIVRPNESHTLSVSANFRTSVSR